MDGSKLLGPWGGHGGVEWNDGVHTGVREITLVYGSCVDSIRVTYDNNGKPFLADKHGGFGGMKSAQVNTCSLNFLIKLQYPAEIFASVSGHYCRVVYGGSPVIRSLTFKTNKRTFGPSTTFKTNKRTFGPFGVEEGTSFNLLTNGDHIVGFTGRSGWFLDSLGFYLSTPKPNQNLSQRFNIMLKGVNHLDLIISNIRKSQSTSFKQQNIT
ncbi:jacalin-related lectin 19-like [Bidens hawaiensis]|uniref:jacalin-related lectin 19-like n=1 Tax=Bidens hawaiensis TaxID=980011 RepID=UPI00404A994A